MTIIKVVVDYLPKNASCCGYIVNLYELVTGGYGLICRFDNHEQIHMSINEFLTKRCPNCPLVEEAEEVQE